MTPFSDSIKVALIVHYFVEILYFYILIGFFLFVNKIKHILGVFSFHNSVFNDIYVIKTTYWVPRSESAATFDPLFFFFLLLFHWVWWVWFLHLLFFLFHFTLGGFFFFFFFSLSLVFFFHTEFGEFRHWGLKKKKKVKAAPSYSYGAHKQMKILSDDKLSDGAKRVKCKELGYFKWWVMNNEN